MAKSGRSRDRLYLSNRQRALAKKLSRFWFEEEGRRGEKKDTSSGLTFLALLELDLE